MGARLVKFVFKPQENEQIEAIVKVAKEPRSVIDGIVKDANGQLIKDAVVKLFEVIRYPYELKPLTHAFTDECGQFIFGPLHPDKQYVIKVWNNDVKIRNLIIDGDVNGDYENEIQNKLDFEEEER